MDEINKLKNRIEYLEGKVFYESIAEQVKKELKSNHFCKGEKALTYICSECQKPKHNRSLLLTKELNSLTKNYLKLEKENLKLIKSRNYYISLSSKFKEQWLELRDKEA